MKAFFLISLVVQLPKDSAGSEEQLFTHTFVPWLPTTFLVMEWPSFSGI